MNDPVNIPVERNKGVGGRVSDALMAHILKETDSELAAVFTMKGGDVECFIVGDDKSGDGSGSAHLVERMRFTADDIEAILRGQITRAGLNPVDYNL